MTLDRKNIAFLTANGVNQNDISMMQRALIQQRIFPKIIGAGSKLITSWDGSQWGHNFAMDVSVTEALGADFDVLIIPGGSRAMDVLSETAHTKRIINSFIIAGKPVVVMGDADSLFKTFDMSLTSDSVRLVSEITEETVKDSVSWFSKFETQDMDQLAA